MIYKGLTPISSTFQKFTTFTRNSFRHLRRVGFWFCFVPCSQLTSVLLERWNRGSSEPWCPGCASFWWCWPPPSGTSHTAHWCIWRWAPSWRTQDVSEKKDYFHNSLNLLPRSGWNNLRFSVFKALERTHQFSLLIWSPKPGVSITVSFIFTPPSSSTAKTDVNIWNHWVSGGKTRNEKKTISSRIHFKMQHATTTTTLTRNLRAHLFCMAISMQSAVSLRVQSCGSW